MNWLRKAPLVLLVLFMVVACNDDVQQGSINDLSEYARNYLKMNMSGASLSSMSLSGQGNPVNGSFQRLYNNAQAFSNGRMAGDSVSIPPSDTTIISDPWVSCAVITTIANAEGSETTTYDYGNGCEEGYDSYKYLMFGKYAYTFMNTYANTGSLFKESYRYKWISENYGGKSYYGGDTTTWLSNGASDYSGESQYDTVKHTYSGSYTYNADNTYHWDTIQYVYKGQGKTTYNEKQFIIESSSYEYGYNGDYYKTEVLEPLVSRFDCNRNYGGVYYCALYISYVSGREFIRYKQGDTEGSFEINYGDGSCNNVVTITENGKSVTVDLSDNNKMIAY